MIEHVAKDLEGLVAVKFSETICQQDYAVLIPEMEKKIKLCGSINFYLELGDGAIWDERNFWSDINFNQKHALDIKKTAFVGNDQWEKKIISLLKPLKNAEVRWYTLSEKHEALLWLRT